MSNERLAHSPERQLENDKALKEAAGKNRERINERLHENLEKHHEDSVEKHRHEALERATQHEKEQRDKETAREVAPQERHGPVTKSHRKQAFDKEMRHVQSQLSPSGRAFSNVIHNPAVEKVSDTLGATIARPNALASGAIFAFILTLGVYLVAQYFGYPLSGSETIVAFVLGWVIGCLYDFLRVMITGKKA